LKQRIDSLSSLLLQQTSELTRLQELESMLVVELEASKREVHRLNEEIIFVQSSLNITRAAQSDELSDLRKDLAESMEVEIALEKDIDEMNTAHVERIRSLEESHRIESGKLSVDHEQTLKLLSQSRAKWS
jgi:hypothetical protein